MSEAAKVCQRDRCRPCCPYATSLALDAIVGLCSPILFIDTHDGYEGLTTFMRGVMSREVVPCESKCTEMSTTHQSGLRFAVLLEELHLHSDANPAYRSGSSCGTYLVLAIAHTSVMNRRLCDPEPSPVLTNKLTAANQ